MAFAQLTSDVEDMVSHSSRGSRRSRGIRAPRGSSAQRLHLLLPRPDPVAAGLQEGRERIENISESRNHRQEAVMDVLNDKNTFYFGQDARLSTVPVFSESKMMK